MSYKSSFPPIDIPDVDLWTLLFERDSKPFPDTKEIFTDFHTARTYTYKDIKSTAASFGAGLKSLWSWRKGDVLALYTPNSIDTSVVTMGTLWAGGVICPANPLYTLAELTHQLRDSGAKGLVTQARFAETALRAALEVGIPRERVLLLGETGRKRAGEELMPEHFTRIASIRSTSYTGRYVRTKMDPKRDVAFLVYSSGTTGLPKGVCLSHRNMVANVLQMAFMEGRTFFPYGGRDGKGDKLLGVLPLFHIYGLMVSLLFAIYLGLQVVLLEKFDLRTALECIQTYGVTMAYVPPPIILEFAKNPAVSLYDIKSLKILHSGAAPLTNALIRAVWERLGIPVKQGFGLSETGSVTHVQSWDEAGKFMGSVGKLVPNMEARIVGLDGRDAKVAQGQSGELWLKGPNIFLGYLNQREVHGDVFSEDGWFKTGDVFWRDRWGNYYCVDRLKELIKYKGFGIPPAELEGLLIGHQEVADVCVIGVDDKERATEVPRAYVVLKPGVEANGAKAEELADWVAQQVAPHKKLRGGVWFIDKVPKSPSGKILRRVVRDYARKVSRTDKSRL